MVAAHNIPYCMLECDYQGASDDCFVKYGQNLSCKRFSTLVPSQMWAPSVQYPDFGVCWGSEPTIACTTSSGYTCSGSTSSSMCQCAEGYSGTAICNTANGAKSGCTATSNVDNGGGPRPCSTNSDCVKATTGNNIFFIVYIYTYT